MQDDDYQVSRNIIRRPSSTVSKHLSRNVSGHFIRSLSSQFPDADETELQKIGDDIIENLSFRIEQGYKPAAARPNVDGSMDLIVLTVERRRKGGN